MAKSSRTVTVLLIVLALIAVSAMVGLFHPSAQREDFFFQVSRCNPKCSGAYYGKPATFQFDTIPSEGVKCTNEQCNSYGMIRGCSTVPVYGTGLAEYSKGCRADATSCDNGLGMPVAPITTAPITTAPITTAAAQGIRSYRMTKIANNKDVVLVTYSFQPDGETGEAVFTDRGIDIGFPLMKEPSGKWVMMLSKDKKSPPIDFVFTENELRFQDGKEMIVMKRI